MYHISSKIPAPRATHMQYTKFIIFHQKSRPQGLPANPHTTHNTGKTHDTHHTQHTRDAHNTHTTHTTQDNTTFIRFHQKSRPQGQPTCSTQNLSYFIKNPGPKGYPPTHTQHTTHNTRNTHDTRHTQHTGDTHNTHTSHTTQDNTTFIIFQQKKRLVPGFLMKSADPCLVRGHKAVGANQVRLPLPYPSPLECRNPGGGVASLNRGIPCEGGPQCGGLDQLTWKSPVKEVKTSGGP